MEVPLGLSESESVAETNLGLESESVAETNLGLDEELPEPETERDLERLGLLELPREPERDCCEAGLEERLRSIV